MIKETPNKPYPVRYLKGVGPQRAQALARFGISTIEDFLYYLPRKYEDRTHVTPIADVVPGMVVTVCAWITRVSSNRRWGHASRLTLRIEDDTGRMDAVFFNQPYLREKFEKGTRAVFSGKAKLYKGLQLSSPEYEILEDEDSEPSSCAIVPFYTVPAGLSQQMLRKLMQNALRKAPEVIEDGIPDALRRKRHLPDLHTALRNAHFPASLQESKEAVRRLKYEEFFVLELALALRRVRNLQKTSAPIKVTPRIDRRIRRLYDFSLTRAQERAISEIVSDLASPHPMNRLLQGDVGSGKTAVAVYALLAAVANGYQAAFMAPTEILAEQHYHTLSRYLKGARVKLAFLSSSTGPQRVEIHRKIASGEIDIAVGTHALVQKKVKFARLALAVVDEQHKFGVMQRGRLRAHGAIPHVLVMTATPIPRTLALTVYGDLDISVLDELPPGRRPVETHFVQRKNEEKVFDFVRDVVKAGRQAYFVYPLIEASQEIQLRSAKEMFQRLSRDIFGEFRVGLLHGRMKPEKKEKTFADFASGRIDILVSTVVIEVGIDVAGAAVMVIDQCERFGLAQLHQLRGRIGRGAYRSTCLLLGEPATEEAKRRVKAILSTTDGFKIAEEDLALRGPGEFFGTKQSGLPDLKIADIVGDYRILRSAAEDAFRLVGEDPALSKKANAGTRDLLLRRLGKRAGLISIG